MLFNILLLVMFAAIAYFHYTQGLFSAALSAILCILAAVTAVGYHETVAQYVITYLKMPEDANALSLILIFVLAYVIPRLIFDNLVPGNVQFPSLVDKIGAGVMGVVAGLFATGVLAVAADSMPFGPAIGGFSRLDLQDRANLTISSNNGRSMDTSVSDEVVSDGFGDPSQRSAYARHLWLHQDELVLWLAEQLSAPGAPLSNGTEFNSVHPDYPLEMFGQRLGVPGGIRQLMVSGDKARLLSVSGAFLLAKTPPHMDGEVRSIRGDQALPDIPTGDALVVVRTALSSPPPTAAGVVDDSHLRISLAGVRLKAGTTDYFPLGTMVGGALLIQNRADDPLLIDVSKGSQTVDFFFAINPDDLNTDTNNGVKTTSFKGGTFLEMMRYSQADLGGMTLSTDSPQTTVIVPENSETLGGVMRKGEVMQEAVKHLSVITMPATADKSGNNSKQQSPPANGGKQDNEFMPSLPNHLMGL